jgi:two-component system nitrogen regulation response regulator GlnG
MPNRDTTTFDAPPPPASDGRARALVVTVLAHPDPRRIGSQAELCRGAAGVAIHRDAPSFSLSASPPRPLATRHVSRQPLLVDGDSAGAVLRSGGGRPVVVDGCTATEHPLSASRLAAGVVVELGPRVLLLLRAGRPVEDAGALGLLGPSPELDALRAEIRLVGSTDHPALIRGETGVGKERVAEAIHRCSRRAPRRLVAVNCAAIPPTTAASQLFGHARGAYTGSVGSHAGYFAEADGGTLFLDEIGEVGTEVQSMLLRALEAHQIQPVGGDVRRVDARVLSATDADLEGLVAQARFRSALLHRLGATVLSVPPLRLRREDIPFQLVAFLREELGPRVGLLDDPADRAGTPGEEPAEPWLGADVIRACVAHDWPGNSRELRAVARWIALHGAGRSTAPVPLLGAPRAPVETDAPPDAARIRSALDAAEHRIEVAAKALGLTRGALRQRMRELGIRRAADLTAEEIAAARARVGGDIAAVAAALQVGEHALRLRLGALARE